jgi:hypothetical protein
VAHKHKYPEEGCAWAGGREVEKIFTLDQHVRGIKESEGKLPRRGSICFEGYTGFLQMT